MCSNSVHGEVLWGLEDMLASPEKEAKDKDKEKSKG
jgi:hypothetical protein